METDLTFSTFFNIKILPLVGTLSEQYAHSKKNLTISFFNTKLGPMLVISDDEALYLLEFFDCRGLEKEIIKLVKFTKAKLVVGSTKPIESIKAEVTSYFDGTLRIFKTPLHFTGTSFQKEVWQELLRVPYGSTRSYAEQSKAIGRPNAHRAVANANGANQLAIIIPCHRIITSDGRLGGYAGGVDKKQWLLNHEKQNV